MKKMIWEEIDPWHRRARTPGGWILKAFEDVSHRTDEGFQAGWDWRVSLCFVPDPTHGWIPEVEEK